MNGNPAWFDTETDSEFPDEKYTYLYWTDGGLWYQIGSYDEATLMEVANSFQDYKVQQEAK